MNEIMACTTREWMPARNVRVRFYAASSVPRSVEKCTLQWFFVLDSQGMRAWWDDAIGWCDIAQCIT